MNISGKSIKIVQKKTWVCCLGCGELFMQNHKLRQFCSDLCYNKDYNENYRDRSRRYLISFDRNLRILEQYKISTNEVPVKISELLEKNFVFDIYSKRYHDYGLGTNIVEYGIYKTYLRADETIIVKLKN
jgi:hypothetical protein